MRTYYVYGQPSLLVKQCVLNSWAENNNKDNIDVKEYIRHEQKKLKGCFIENFYFGYSSTRSILDRLCNLQKLNYKKLDEIVKAIISSCFITYRTVVENLHYQIDKPEYIKIKTDIECILDQILNEEFNSSVKSIIIQYKANFSKNYNAIIDVTKHETYKEWNNGPSESVREQFKNCYTYGKRRTDNKKWNWLKGKTAEEVALKFINDGVFELTKSVKQRIKMTEGLSIKAVNDILKAKVKSMSDTEKHKITVKIDVNKWFFSMDDKMKNNCANVISSSDKYAGNSYQILMFDVYGYKHEWMTNRRFQFTKEIKQYIDDLNKNEKE